MRGKDDGRKQGTGLYTLKATKKTGDSGKGKSQADESIGRASREPGGALKKEEFCLDRGKSKAGFSQAVKRFKRMEG